MRSWQRLLTAVIVLLFLPRAQGDDYSTWSKCMPITFAGYTPADGGALTNFPVLVILSNTAAGDGFYYNDFLSSSNDDLRFTAADKSTPLNYEIERWDTNGASHVWVQVAALTDATTAIWVLWGKDGVSAPACTTNGAVWTEGYLGVWHLAEDPTAAAPQFKDSSTNGNHATADGLAADDQLPGAIDGSVRLDGDGDCVKSSSFTYTFGTAISLSGWFKLTGAGTGSPRILEISKNGDSSGHCLAVDSDGSLRAWAQSVTGRVDSVDDPTTYTDGNWHQMVYVYAGASAQLYVDGKVTATASGATSDLDDGPYFIAGAIWGTQTAHEFDGSIDELRVAAVSRSSNWVWAAWLNAASNAVFENYGTPEFMPTAPVVQNQAATNIFSGSACLNGMVVSTGAAPIDVVAVYWGMADGGAPTSGLWAATNTVAGGPWTNGAFATYQATELTANVFYYFRYYATNANGAGWASSSEYFLAGDLIVTNTDPVATRTPFGAPDTGTLTLQRDPSATNEALTVYYTWSGTALEDQDYTLSPAGTNVTLPAGVASTAITITAVWNGAGPQGSKTLWLSLLPGAYSIGAPASNDVAIEDYVYTPGANNTTNAGDWNNNAIWSQGRRPLPGDDVTIRHAVTLSNATDRLNSFVISNAVLTFTNWNIFLMATEVTIQSNGQMTLPPAFTNSMMSNRVWIACSNLTIEAGGYINVDGKGYAKGTDTRNGQGPGGGGTGGNAGGGAGHGGAGSGGYNGLAGGAYDTASAPMLPGSGGGGCSSYPSSGADGGGAVRIEAMGAVLINGTISANGNSDATGGRGAGGSGGSVYIACNTFAGTNGVIRANGGTGTSSGGAGGGGRIAVIYDVDAQALLEKPRVLFSVNRASGYGGANFSDIGTLYFPDTGILDPAWMVHNGVVVVPGFTAWSMSSLLVSNGYMRISSGNPFALTVTNDLVIAGPTGILWLVNGAIACDDLSIAGAGSALEIGANSVRTNVQSLLCAGNLMVSNNAALYIYAAVTNTAQTNYGALVDVVGDIAIATNGRIYPYSYNINGGSVLFRFRSMAIAAGGAINADGMGWRGGYGGGGYGPGHGYAAVADGSGAGYGGKGGRSPSMATVGTTYGVSNAPMYPGSGGGARTGYATATGGNGGGLVRLEAQDTIEVDGTISANGGVGWHGGGSGGGIYLFCRQFAGGVGGLLRADGGDGGTSGGGGGGGGRIAVWRMPARHFYQGSYSVIGGTLYGAGSSNGLEGTIFFGDNPGKPGWVLFLR